MKLSDMLFANAMMGEGGGGGGGGGGSSDFSTATVTITNNRSLSAASVFVPYVNESYNDAEPLVLVEPNEVVTVTVILYKGSAYGQEGYPASTSPSSVSGDVSKEDGGYVITGNGTITYTD